ncbi:ubiquinone biosynthesis O-methyltransferase [Abditibacteriota bacterium]|nr:ubiquinone biosynthesis O-methyltransferase [Abditibacteriota bacterium]
MQDRLLNFLSDPNDGGSLELHAFSSHLGQTRDGVLVNPSTGRWYVVQDGIPTLFADELRPDDSDFIARYESKLREIGCEFKPVPTKDGDFARIESERRARDEQAQDYDAMWSLKALSLFENPVYKKAMSVDLDSPLLEAGCGTGRLTAIFAEIAPEVVAVDMSRESIVRNRARHFARTHHPVHYIHADLTHLPLQSKKFGRCAHAGVYEHIPSRGLRLQFLEHAQRVLTDDGTLMLSAYRYGGLTKIWEKEGEHDGGIPFFRFTEEELKDEVQQYFDIEQFRENLAIYMSMVVAKPKKA